VTAPLPSSAMTQPLSARMRQSEQNVGIGDTLRLRLGDGTPATLRVVAIYGRGLGFGDLILSRDVTSHVDNPLDDFILIKAIPSVRKELPSRLASHLRRFVADAALSHPKGRRFESG